MRDYAFLLNPNAGAGEDKMRVHFKLVDATAGAKDNVKETDESKRYFILDVNHPYEWMHGEIDAEGVSFQELVVRFEFRPSTFDDWESDVKAKATLAAQKKPPVQAHLIDIADNFLLREASKFERHWKSALETRYLKTNDERAEYSTLKGHLNNYTKKNTFDYFIHKDLGGFLRRELDFYIKNELMQWEDLAALKNTPERLAPILSKLDVIRNLGAKIIAFLAQLENFQKKLWLKKKFVTETNYCITLDRVPESLYGEIINNQAQHDEWVNLFAIDEIKGDLLTPEYSNPLSMEFLQANQNLVLDTHFFNDEFKADLVASIEDLDGQCNGLLIHSENFQALNLLQERYKERVRCVYIDPPYNAPNSEIAYKNNYKHSSFLSLMNDRLRAHTPVLDDSGSTIVAIDKHEQNGVFRLIKDLFPKNKNVSVTVEHNRKGVQGDNFSFTHEYAIFSMSPKLTQLNQTVRPVSEYEYSNLRNWGGESLREDAANCFYAILVKNNEIVGFGDVWRDLNIHPSGANISRDDGIIEVFPIDRYGIERKWRYERGTIESILHRLKAEVDRDGIIQIYIAKTSDQFKTVWYSPKYNAGDNGTQLANQMGIPIEEFDYPKSIFTTKDCIYAVTGNNDLVLDYFSGSGTTGQAVIALNREIPESNRKFLLVEMGQYFDKVTKARISKASYSPHWKNGKPVSRDTGISHCFKYIRLESYEDTLGNLRLEQKPDLFNQNSDNEARQAYVMNYMLDVETRGSQSLLNIQQFLDPTQYELNVRSPSGDETVPVKVDLLETFNYLLGLEVEHIAAPVYFDAEIFQGEYGRWQADVKQNRDGKWWFRTVYGKNRQGQQVLVVWRNLPSMIEEAENGLQYDNAVLDSVLVDRLKIRLTESLDDEIDVLYVNGDHNINIPRNRRGELMEQARVQLIEEAFHRLMFADTETGF